MARVTGHGLEREGAPYDHNGHLLSSGWVHTSGPGRGKCECGALSEVLHSGNARRKWHRDVHKPQVAATEQGARQVADAHEQTCNGEEDQ